MWSDLLSMSSPRGGRSVALLLCHVVIAAFFHTGFELVRIYAAGIDTCASHRPQRMRICVYCDFWSKVRVGRYVACLTIVLSLLKSLR
jgi:hypothetical protein